MQESEARLLSSFGQAFLVIAVGIGVAVSNPELFWVAPVGLLAALSLLVFRLSDRGIDATVRGGAGEPPLQGVAAPGPRAQAGSSDVRK